ARTAAKMTCRNMLPILTQAVRVPIGTISGPGGDAGGALAVDPHQKATNNKKAYLRPFSTAGSRRNFEEFYERLQSPRGGDLGSRQQKGFERRRASRERKRRLDRLSEPGSSSGRARPVVQGAPHRRRKAAELRRFHG